MQHPTHNIAIFDKFLGYTVGGAQRSLHRLLRGLSLDTRATLLGCDVQKSFNARKMKDDTWQVERSHIVEFPRFPYFEYWLNRRTLKKLSQSRVEHIMISQGLWGSGVIRFFPGKTIYFVRDEYQLNRIPNYFFGLKRILKYLYLFIQLPFILVLFRDNKMAIQHADLVVANSVFMKKEIKRIFDVDAELVYPMRDVDDILSRHIPSFSERKYITLIGSEYIKGRTIVEDIAKNLTEEQFLIVGREFKHPEKHGNITYHPWVKDPMDIYRQTKLLIVPSICTESSPGVAIEAQALGIPVLGSENGGIPELLNATCIVRDNHNIKEWKQKITRALVTHERAELSESREKMLQFHQSVQVKRFTDILQKFSLNTFI